MIKDSPGKIVYNGHDGYVYSELLDLKLLYANQYATYKPNETQLSDYKKYLEKAYKLAEKHFNLEIIEIDHIKGIYKTRCPKYDGDLNYLYPYPSAKTKNNVVIITNPDIKIDKIQIIDKVIDLIVYLKQHQLVHGDFAFRNICYTITDTDKLTLHMIDFEQLHEHDNTTNSDYNEIVEMYIEELIDYIEKESDDIKTHFMKLVYEKFDYI